MSDHTTGTSPKRLALSGSAAHRRADVDGARPEYLTANPTALRQEDPR